MVIKSKKPVAVIMGSQSDWATMRHATEMLEALDIGFELRFRALEFASYHDLG